MKRITNLKNITLEWEYITYDEDFNPTLQSVEDYHFSLQRIAKIQTSLGDIILPFETKYPKKKKVKLKSFDNLQPVSLKRGASVIKYIYAVPIFKVVPKYLLVGNIVVEYPNEIVSS